MKFSKFTLFLAFCLPVFFSSCRKDNGNGKYIAKATAIGNNTLLEVLRLIARDGKLADNSNGNNGYYYKGNGGPVLESEVVEAQGFLRVYAVAARESSAKGKIGVKIEIFKIGSNGKKTKVASVTKTAGEGFIDPESLGGWRYYGASIQLPGNIKKLSRVTKIGTV